MKLVVALLVFAPTAGMAFNITVGDFGGAGNSTNGSFVAGVWTPTADSNLDYADLQTALNAGTVSITTNGAGTIEFGDESAEEPTFSLAASRTLNLLAEGDVIIDYFVADSGAPGAASLNVEALGSVTIAPEVIAGNSALNSGVKLNGGDFTSSGTDFSCGAFCIVSGGGDINLNHTGEVSFINGAGPNTAGGVYTSTGTDFYCDGGCIQTYGGDIALNHTGSVTLTDNGAYALGGNYSSSGTDFFCESGCIHTYGGDIALNHTGTVTLTDGGASSGGGNYTSRGTDFSCTGGCIRATGGDVNLNHTGNLTVTDGGITSDGGGIVAKAAGDIAVSDDGVRSGGGDITLYYGNNLSLAAASKIVSGNGSTLGGKIILHAVNSMTINGEVSSASGSGGTLSVDDGVTVSGTGTTAAGAGDVNLYLRSKPQILDILGLAVMPVPTLGALSTGILAGLTLLLSWHRRRAVA